MCRVCAAAGVRKAGATERRFECHPSPFGIRCSMAASILDPSHHRRLHNVLHLGWRSRAGQPISATSHAARCRAVGVGEAIASKGRIAGQVASHSHAKARHVVGVETKLLAKGKGHGIHIAVSRRLLDKRFGARRTRSSGWGRCGRIATRVLEIIGGCHDRDNAGDACPFLRLVARSFSNDVRLH